jgi:hypothetical protein
MSYGVLMNLAAIEHSDHMTSPHADKYDLDGWYRATITELIKVIREQHAERTLHVTVNSWGDWLLLQDGGGTPTRVAVKW